MNSSFLRCTSITYGFACKKFQILIRNHHIQQMDQAISLTMLLKKFHTSTNFTFGKISNLISTSSEQIIHKLNTCPIFGG